MNKKKKNVVKIILVILLLGGIIFYANTSILKKIKDKILRAFNPVVGLSMGIKNIFFSAGQENKTIQEKDLRLRSLEFELRKAEQENQVLSKAFNFKNQGKFNLLGAKTIFYGKELGREFLTLETGQKDGAELNDLVIDQNRVLLGKISEINDNFSKVDIASNAGLNFEVEILGSGIRALAEGLGSKTFAIKLVPRENQLKPGDFVALTGGYYNSLLVGQISGVKTGGGGAFLEISATSLSSPENLKEAFIIQNSRKQ